jgi:hypothetical protein
MIAGVRLKSGIRGEFGAALASSIVERRVCCSFRINGILMVHRQVNLSLVVNV